MKPIFILLLLFATNAYSQSADFIVIKKRNKTIAHYFAGNDISFVTSTGAGINAHITQIKNDTIYLQEFLVQKLMTNFGTFVLDTMGSYHYKYHYNQVKMIGRNKRQNFDWKGSGAVLLGGGTLITLGSGIVYLLDRQKFSAPLMAASAGLATLGYFMAKGKSDAITLGKKYRLSYMNMSNIAH